MTAPAENRYVFDDVDEDAETTPGRYPVTLFPPAPKSLSAMAPPKPVRVDQAMAALWKWEEVRGLLSYSALVSAAVLIGFHLAHFWLLGGWVGVWASVELIAPGAVFGAALVWVVKR